MRILKVRFKNLNSLVGDWSIDFTDPAYTSNGIFAITGPTGAGKTTILDAICLALYGQTPRLGGISQSSNEIMSRRASESEAEVMFETAEGRFRCVWQQRRARNKADGLLQAPKRELTDAATELPLETQIRGVAERVEAITGMDFVRFTRSMMLAQGAFAAFLQSDANNRSDILERITGTEIYSEISKRVFEKKKTETQRLEQLQGEFAGIEVLNAEQVAAL
ncbi:MAG: AAA family ATPase [Planctomycetota bacterium]